MFTIGEVVIEDQLAGEKFFCDLVKCKGACCTLPGGRGAPLQDSEVEELEKAYPFVQRYLSDQSKRLIKQHGMVEGLPGSYATTCVDDNDCVFVYYEEGIARCAVERAYHQGEIQWRKPLSCHLFPVRISTNGADRVRYEKISECNTARTAGRNLDMPLFKFLKDALIRKYGMAWYEEFYAECERRNSLLSSL